MTAINERDEESQINTEQSSTRNAIRILSLRTVIVLRLLLLIGGSLLAVSCSRKPDQLSVSKPATVKAADNYDWSKITHQNPLDDEETFTLQKLVALPMSELIKLQDQRSSFTTMQEHCVSREFLRRLSKISDEELLTQLEGDDNFEPTETTRNLLLLAVQKGLKPYSHKPTKWIINRLIPPSSTSIESTQGQRSDNVHFVQCFWGIYEDRLQDMSLAQMKELDEAFRSQGSFHAVRRELEDHIKLRTEAQNSSQQSDLLEPLSAGQRQAPQAEVQQQIEKAPAKLETEKIKQRHSNVESGGGPSAPQQNSSRAPIQNEGAVRELEELSRLAKQRHQEAQQDQP